MGMAIQKNAQLKAKEVHKLKDHYCYCLQHITHEGEGADLTQDAISLPVEL